MALGKGLGSLIPSFKNKPTTGSSLDLKLDKILQDKNADVQDKEGRIWFIPVSLVKSNSFQPRQNFGHQDLEELANSVKEHGILQPLLVTEKENGTYELIAGERRYRAALIAGLSSVPVIIKKAAGLEKLELALIENIQRENLNPLEEAFAFERLTGEFGLSQEEVAKKISKSRPYVGNSLRLLGLPQEIQKAVMDGVISRSAARAILGLANQRDQLKLYRQFTREKKATRDLEREVSDSRLEKTGWIRRDPVVIDYERELREALGTKVRITKSGEKGVITIHYYSDEELKRIIKSFLK
ncbi:MAG: ParB/RepB/Spo0J family partition protein [Candidatus Magasanikbacteria bacterium]|nr:ParB/RepB/Spo0J family partition protein [Candidatus Magasanikbacteria bacterium]